MSSKKVIGVAILDNGMSMSIKGKIPFKIPQLNDYIKRLFKGTIVITTPNAYDTIVSMFGIKDIIVVTQKPGEFSKHSIYTTDNFKDAIEYASSHTSSKVDVMVMTGPEAAGYLYENNLYDEFIAARIDMDYAGDKVLGIDFRYHPEIKVSEEFYYSGVSFWYERYDMKNKLKYKTEHIPNLHKLEELEIDTF